VVVGLARMTDDERPDLRPMATLAERRESSSSALAAQVSCAMLAVLAAAIVYLVAISNQVTSGREDLGRLSGEVVAAERDAAALKPYADFVTATLARREAVSTVARTRFNWDRALTELAQVDPNGVWLTSAKGTLTPTTSVSGGADSANTGSLRRVLAVPALELSGCARREGLVPAYIDKLHAITGVTEVGFSRSERLEKAGSAGGGGGDCRNGDVRAARFGLVTYFKAAPGQIATAADTAATPAPAPVTPAPANPAAAAPATATPPPATAPANQTASATTGGSR
jgi:Tfp pilus assembly protein PilN